MWSDTAPSTDLRASGDHSTTAAELVEQAIAQGVDVDLGGCRHADALDRRYHGPNDL